MIYSLLASNFQTSANVSDFSCYLSSIRSAFSVLEAIERHNAFLGERKHTGGRGKLLLHDFCFK
jgi:hypothetical protein